MDDRDAEEFHDGFNHTFGRVAVFVHHPFGERTVVHTDADSRLMFAAYIEQVHEFFFQFRSIFAVVTRVDAHGFHHLCGSVCYFGIEMHIRHDRYGGQHLRMDLFERFHLPDTLCRETQEFRSGLDTTSCLINRSVDIVGVGVRHRLDTNRVV